MEHMFLPLKKNFLLSQQPLTTVISCGRDGAVYSTPQLLRHADGPVWYSLMLIIIAAEGIMAMPCKFLLQQAVEDHLKTHAQTYLKCMV